MNRFKRSLVYTEEVHSPSKGCPLRLNLCMCVKKKLYFFRWVPSRRTFVPPSEVDDPSIVFWPSEYSIMEPARSLQFCGLETLMIASRSDYMRLNLVTKEVTLAFNMPIVYYEFCCTKYLILKSFFVFLSLLIAMDVRLPCCLAFRRLSFASVSSFCTLPKLTHN